MRHTKEERRAYLKALRDSWKEAKEKADIEGIKAVIEEYGLSVSVYSFAYVSLQMKRLGLSGVPYIDMKTYEGWLESGYQVRRGEKSKVSGIVWIRAEKDDGEKGYSFPKVYHLFHKSQVEEVKC